MVGVTTTNIVFIILAVYQHVYNIHLKGTVSQNFEIVPSSLFYVKKRDDFNYFFINIFLGFIKYNLGPI